MPSKHEITLIQKPTHTIYNPFITLCSQVVLKGREGKCRRESGGDRQWWSSTSGQAVVVVYTMVGAASLTANNSYTAIRLMRTKCKNVYLKCVLGHTCHAGVGTGYRPQSEGVNTLSCLQYFNCNDHRSQPKP
jgi:hypothetical protein